EPDDRRNGAAPLEKGTHKGGVCGPECRDDADTGYTDGGLHGRVRYHEPVRHHRAARSSARLRWTVASGFPVFAAAVILTAHQKPAEDDSFDQLYRRGSEINATLKTLTARFTETTTSSLLTRPLVASGIVAVERPLKVVLHYQQPELRDVLIDGDRLTVSWPARHIRDVTNIAAANRRIHKYYVDIRPALLRESFDISDENADDRPRTYRLTMV